MKTSITFVVFLIAVVFTSCTGGFHIEKRHYRDGFYIATGSKQESSNNNAVREKPFADIEVVTKTETLPAVTADEQPHDQQAEPADTLTAQSHAISEIKNSPDTFLIREKNVPEAASSSELASSENTPENIRTLNTLFRIALIMFGVAVLLFLLSLLFPPAALVTLILAGTAFGSAFIAVTLDVAILIVSGNQKQRYKDTDKTTSDAYAVIEKRALLFIAGLAVAAAIFLIALLIAAIRVILYLPG